jgi:pimeloyl-ACP methyl ester carboxylesterase
MSSVEPLYFAADRRLFGCLHPSPQPDARLGVVMVQPAFGEYTQHHRAFYVLAEALADRGFPCLRYDHFGTGDSASDLMEARLSDWIGDVTVAARALVASGGVKRICLLGARLGASLALAAAPKIARTSGLVLWEPVWSGRDYLKSLLATHEEVLRPWLGASPDKNADAEDVLGFEIGRQLWTDLNEFSVDLALVSPELDACVLLSEPRGPWLPPDGYSRVSTVGVEHPIGWLQPDDGMYDVLMPADVVQKVVRWVERSHG